MWRSCIRKPPRSTDSMSADAVFRAGACFLPILPLYWNENVEGAVMMKEQIHTIPVNEAFDAGDECPFCFMERQLERSAIRYFAGPGASYMEPDVRLTTDKAGFCREHMKKLYDYGNTLGSALMLQTYFAGVLDEFQTYAESFEMPEKKSLFSKKKPENKDTYWKRLEERGDSCAICDKIEYNLSRYYHTFFYLLKDGEFRTKVEHSKGFCLRHLARLLKEAEESLPNAQREWFYKTVFALEEEHLVRVKEDLDWLVAKYDYRNAGKDWKNSKDALQRTMQKLEGLYPADPPYKNE